LLRAAGCRWVPIPGVRRRAAAEICREVHPDAAGRRVAVVHRDEPGRALPPGAFPAVRRVDSDTGRKAGRVEKESAGPVTAVLRRDAVLPELRARFQQDLLLPDAAPAALQVAEALPQQRRPAEGARSDALDEQRPGAPSGAPLSVWWRAPQLADAAERRAPDLSPAPQLAARARRAPQESRAEAQELERPPV
jgi:hypothetical protein